MARFKFYQAQVAVGCAFAILLALLRQSVSDKNNLPLFQALEVASFALCCIGLVAGGRAHRATYEALGSSRSIAIAKPSFMRDRRDLQITGLAATSAMASLLAGRYGLNPFGIGLMIFAGLAAALPLINRATGWVSKA